MYTGAICVHRSHVLVGKKSYESENVYAVAQAFIFVAMVIVAPYMPKNKACA